MLQSVNVHRLYSRHDANVDSVWMVFFGPGPGLAGLKNLLNHLLRQALGGRLPTGQEQSHADVA